MHRHEYEKLCAAAGVPSADELGAAEVPPPTRAEASLVRGPPALLRRAQAAAYLRERGIPVTPNGLAKLAVLGDGPPMTYYGRIPLYAVEALDRWAAEKLEAPVTSTAARREAKRTAAKLGQRE